MADSEQPLRSPLFDRHQSLGARFAQVAGWEVPLSYRGALEEADLVRRHAAVLDLSHVGRLRIRGDGALDLLERLCTSDVARQEDNSAATTLLCNDAGGIIDCCTLLRLEDCWLLLTSPMQRMRVLEHTASHAAELGAKVDDQTLKIAQLALAGPDAPALLDRVLPFKASDMPDGAVRTGSLLIARYIAARTAIGGGWALHVIVPNSVAGMAWDFITRKAGANAVPPAGIGAHDVLCIEAGVPRYGCELNETIDPWSASLESLVSMNHDFVGKGAVAAIAERPLSRVRRGLLLEPGGAQDRPWTPRRGQAVLDAEGNEVGTITSATFSPARQAVVAAAYVAPNAWKPGSTLHVQYPDRRVAAIATDLALPRP